MNFKNRYYYRTLVIFITLLAISLNLSVIFATDLLSIGKITPYNTYLNISGLMYVSSTNVGIGTPSPSSTLHVVGSATITNGLTVSGGTVSLPNGQIDDAEIADLSWTKLKNYPASCGAGKAIQALGDTLTCVDVNPSNGITGSGTSGRLAKFTGTNTIGNSGISDSSDAVAITIDSSENVGIGTTTPSAKLQVSGGAIMPAVGNSASAGIYWPTNPGGGSGDEAYIRYYVESGENTKLRIGISNDADDDIGFYQYGAERMTIYNGNVGIGTTTPAYKLDVNGQVRIQTLNAGSTNTVVTHSSGVLQTRTIDSRVWGSSLVDYSGTSANYIPKMLDSDTITNSVMYESSGNIGIGTTSPVTKLHVYKDYSFSSVNNLFSLVPFPAQLVLNDNSQRLYLGAYYQGGVYSGSAIQSSDFYSNADHPQPLLLNPLGGNVGIGTTSPADSLDVNGDIRVRGGDIKDSGGTARITFSGTNIILSLG